MGETNAGDVGAVLQRIRKQARAAVMKCSMQGCPGEYEERRIVHTVRRRGQVVVIDHVPAEVCTVCGDVLLSPQTVQRIEELLRDARPPSRTAPLLEYA